MIEITLTTAQKVVVSLHPRTLVGTPAPLDGVPEWGIINGDGTVEAADDGMSAELVSSDLPGVTTYLVVVDADLGLGVEEVSEVITLTSVNPNGQALGIVIAPAVPKMNP